MIGCRRVDTLDECQVWLEWTLLSANNILLRISGAIVACGVA